MADTNNETIAICGNFMQEGFFATTLLRTIKYNDISIKRTTIGTQILDIYNDNKGTNTNEPTAIAQLSHKL